MDSAAKDSSALGLKIGAIRGVPVFIGRSWALIAALIVLAFGPTVAASKPQWGVLAYLVALAYAGLLLFSVLAHEAAHAVTGQLCGYRVRRIVADLMGGHTAYDTEGGTPGRSALVAAVGPLSNALLALFGQLALSITHPGGVTELLLVAFTWSNTFVAIFNALPGLPLDGGFVVDALVWKLTGNRASGMKAAGWSGRIVAVLVMLWATWRLIESSRWGGTTGLWTFAWMLFIAMFLWRGAGRAITAGHNRQFLSGIRVADVMQPAISVPASTPIGDIPATGGPVVLLNPHGSVEAVLLKDVHGVAPPQLGQVLSAEAFGVAVPASAVIDIDNAEQDIMAILPAFEGPLPPQRVVITHRLDGRRIVLGVAETVDVENAMARHAERLRGR